MLLLEPVGGIAGDMFLAAAIDLGVSPQAISDALSGLNVPGWRLAVSRAVRHAISGTHLDVELDQAEHHPHRALADIEALVHAAKTLSPRAKERALAVFAKIGAAEAKIHGVPVSEIHFHEVGAVDSIVDICGAAVALELLGDPEVYSTPPPLGSGTIKVAHGNMPVPAPATLELLHGVPVKFEGRGELTTPTGAALLATFARFDPPPSLVVRKTGYGVGTKDFADRPNVLRASLAERPAAARPPSADATYVIEANLDDCSPQFLGALIERLLAAGALDAWVTPATMKKSRPGHLFGALVPGALREQVISLILSETTTIGLRSHAVERTVLDRRFETVQTRFGEVQVKLAEREGKLFNAFPEFEDCRRLAEANQVPLKQVWAEALTAFHRKRDGQGT